MKRKIRISSPSFLKEQSSPQMPTPVQVGGVAPKPIVTGRDEKELKGGNETESPFLPPDTTPTTDITNLWDYTTSSIWQDLVFNNTYMGVDLTTLFPGFDFSDTTTWPQGADATLSFLIQFITALLNNNNYEQIISTAADNSVNEFFSTGITNTYSNLFTSPEALREYYLQMEAMELLFSWGNENSIFGVLTYIPGGEDNDPSTHGPHDGHGPAFVNFINILMGQTTTGHPIYVFDSNGNYVTLNDIVMDVMSQFILNINIDFLMYGYSPTLGNNIHTSQGIIDMMSTLLSYIMAQFTTEIDVTTSPDSNGTIYQNNNNNPFGENQPIGNTSII